MPVYIPSKKQNPKQEPAYRPPPSYENPISSYYDNAQDSVVNTALAFDEDTGGGGLSLARISKNVKGSNRKKRKYLLYQRGNSIIKGEEYDTQKGSKAISKLNVGEIIVKNGDTKVGKWRTVERMNNFPYLLPSKYLCEFRFMTLSNGTRWRSIRVVKPLDDDIQTPSALYSNSKSPSRIYFHQHNYPNGDPSRLLGCIGVIGDQSIMNDIFKKLNGKWEDGIPFYLKIKGVRPDKQ